jgi:hypothetical protein
MTYGVLKKRFFWAKAKNPIKTDKNPEEFFLILL